MNFNLLKNKLTILIVLFSIFSVRSYSQGTTELKVFEDTYVSEPTPTVVHNTETDMGVALDKTNGDTKEVYLKFDISELYGKGGIANVNLEIAAAQQFAAPYHGIPDFFIEVFGCSEPWDELTLTWDNKPTSDKDILATENINNFNRYKLIKTETSDTSLIAYISAAMSKKAQFVSFIIKGKDETPASRIWISDIGYEPAKLFVEQSYAIPEPGSENSITVSSITIKADGDATTITTDNGTLQMNSEVLPVDATFKDVKWSLDPLLGTATISKTGFVSAKENGKVTVIATSTDGTYIEGRYELTISGQIEKLNLITNGNFDNVTDLDSWKFAPTVDVQQPVITDGHAMFNVEKAGDYWSYSFKQDKLEAVVGVPYIFAFKAWSNLDRSMIVDFEDSNNKYARYGISTDPGAQLGRADWICSLSSTPTQFIFHVTFDPEMVKENTNQLIVFQAGAELGEINLDAIELIKESNYTSASKSLSNSGMLTFPNPVQNELIFSEEVSQVRITSILGQEVKRFSNVADRKFNVSGLKSGIYFVTTQNLKGIIFTSKIVKN